MLRLEAVGVYLNGGHAGLTVYEKLKPDPVAGRFI